MRVRTWRPMSSSGQSETYRDRRLRVAALALVACFALAWQAQAAHASSGKVTVVKINDGGAAADGFSFTTQLKPTGGAFTLVGGQQQTFKVECNASSKPTSCQRTNKPVLQITEQPAAGYDLTGIVCRHRLDGREPTSASSPDPDTTVSGATIDFKVFVKEWVKCWVTNTPEPPAIAIDKVGPLTATAGDLVAYTLQVTNAGPQPFAAQSVVVTDALCQAAPALTSVNGDATPGSLDPGETWTYGCSVQTQAGQTQVANSATAQAVDRHNQGASSTDDFTTTLGQPGATGTDTSTASSSGSTPVPQIEVLPLRQTPGSAQLRGPSTCTRVPAVQATVTGRNISRVTFYLDGKRARTLSRGDARGRWTLSTRVRAFGTHRVRAVVQFTRESGTESKTLRLNFSRCRAVVARPQFTG
jgi:uncharacterized repeat protein (TIGR01451 family)